MDGMIVPGARLIQVFFYQPVKKCFRPGVADVTLMKLHQNVTKPHLRAP